MQELNAAMPNSRVDFWQSSVGSLNGKSAAKADVAVIANRMTSSFICSAPNDNMSRFHSPGPQLSMAF
jgi:hypothetical protein